MQPVPAPFRPIEAPKTIAVYVGLDLVGDGLMKLPFVRALRAAYPQAKITWLAGKGRSVYSGALAPLVAGLVDEVIDDAGIGSRVSELFGSRPLPERHFDLLIDSQRRLLTTLILRRIRHRHFISGTADYLFCTPRPPKALRRKDPSLVGQMLWLLELASGKTPDTQAAPPLPEGMAERARALLPPGPDYIGLAPGAGGKHKCWPLAHYAELGRRQAARGRVPVFLLGPEEGEWRARLAAEVPGALIPDVTASPLLTIAAGGLCRAAVANDSGTGHMLAASGTRLLSLFGPTRAERFAPLGAKASAVLRAQDFPPAGTGAEGADAMARIPVEAVEAALESLLASQSPLTLDCATA